MTKMEIYVKELWIKDTKMDVYTLGKHQMENIGMEKATQFVPMEISILVILKTIFYLEKVSTFITKDPITKEIFKKEENMVWESNLRPMVIFTKEALQMD